jgi:hypothetical protein
MGWEQIASAAGGSGGGLGRSVRFSSQDGPDAVEADEVGVRAV